jgi:osmotically-inducible protein OsmY
MLAATKHTTVVHPHLVEHKAHQRMAKTGYRTLKNVECSFRDGWMTLRGEVPSYYHKQLAQESVRNSPHVTRVVNDIEVLS